MNASLYVGRVGVLAAALGIGVAVFAGAGAAWADGAGAAQTSSPGSDGAGGTGSPAGPSARGHRTTGAGAASRVQRSSLRPAAATAPTVPSVTATLPETAAEALRGAASAVASVGGASASAAKATAQTFTSNGLTVTPTVTIANGIIQGTLGATSDRGATLRYGVVDSSAGAKLALGTGPGTPTAQDFTVLPYATWLTAGSQTPSGTQTVDVRVSEVTQFDQFVTSIPLVGTVAGPVIDLLQKLPLISTLLAPIIGASLVATVSVDVGSLSAGRPIAYTYKVASFDGTEISANWFPSVSVAGAAVGAAESPTIFNGPGIGAPGQTDPYAEWGIGNQTLGVGTLRNAVLTGTNPGTGYNVVTWDPRGEFASGGQLQLDNPFFEGRDVSALVSWIADPAVNSSTLLNGRGDPAVGMVGGSYGGGIQMNVAGTDPRIDAIVPDIAWNSMNDSIYPDDVGRTAYTALLALGLITSGARINPQIYEAVITGVLFGWLSERSQAFIAGAGVTSMLNQLQAPTLLTQGTVDAIFPLQQSLANAQTIIDNPYGVPTNVVWFCGGHGVCADFTSGSPQGLAQAELLKNDALAWLDSYVNPALNKPNPLPARNIPNFQWVDQLGNINNSGTVNGKFPFQSGFNDLPNITGSGAGGLLGIFPFAIGGSGPGAGSLPYSAGNGSPAATGINVDVTVPPGTQVVGAPTVSFTYSGLGTARAVFAQVIDKSTGRVLGNQVSPIPVTLDGQQHTVSVPIADIAYTYGGATNPGQLTVQITGSATAFWNSAWGAVNISNVSVALPNRTPNAS